MTTLNKRPPLLSDPPSEVHKGLRELVLLGALSLSLYLLLAFVTYDPADGGVSGSADGAAGLRNAAGALGAWLADALLFLFGLTSYLLPPLLAWQGWRFWRGQPESLGIPWPVRACGSALTLLTLAAAVQMLAPALPEQLPASSGGVLGELAYGALLDVFGSSGTRLFLLVALVSGLTLSTGASWLRWVDWVGEGTIRAFDLVLRSSRQRRARRLPPTPPEVVHASQQILNRPAARLTPVFDDAHFRPVAAQQPDPALGELAEDDEAENSAGSVRPRRQNQRPATSLPTLDLLSDSKPRIVSYSGEDLQAMATTLENILKEYGVDARVQEIHPGPVVTRFEIQPAAGIKSSRISNLDKDLARALRVPSVRIVEIIPGKSFIGIEVPNRERELVLLREVLASSVYADAESPLTLVLGKDISGRPITANLGKMPHLLVAGTTGSGKSVAVNVMILSLLYKARPEDVRLIMIDPKMLELSVYADIPHLLTPVVTDMKEAANALRWCVAEMERRYRLMSHFAVRNIAGFNAKVREAERNGTPLRNPLASPDDLFDERGRIPHLEPLPYIVIVIDELADMMMIVGKKVEELIARLAQKARAAGVHLILATQRPSVDVITGLIKANIPTRVAFQVSSKIDSRTIIDQSGAEALLGNGDMLFLPPGMGLPARVHGAFVADAEVYNVVEYIKSTGPADYLPEITQYFDETSGGAAGSAGGFGDEAGDGEGDPLYDEAVRFVTESRKASISSVQRRLKVGYNRAARMIEMMERAGVVGPAEHNGNRTVLAPPPPAI